MQTPWGDLSVCDAHVHFFSSNFFRTLAKQTKDGTLNVPEKLGWSEPPDDPAALAAEWVRELDRHGVRRAAIIGSLPNEAGSIQAAQRTFPDRLFGYFMCDPQAPGALEQVRYAFDSGLQGLCLFPAMHNFSVASDAARAVIREAASRRGTVVFVHCGVLSVGIRTRLGLPSRFDMRCSNPVDLHPVAMEFPKLPFVVPHFGAGYFREALMLCDLCPNVHLDTSSSNSWTKYMTPVPTLQQVFAQALSICGPGRLLFGTDSSFFPRGWHRAIFDSQVAALEPLGLNRDQAQAIFGGTLDRLLEI